MVKRRPTGQPDLFDQSAGRADADAPALIAQLITATRLYDSKAALDGLMAFTVRLRAFAPFNAMLLHIQKPGLTHAATAPDWRHRFGRTPKPEARPLLILRTMGPVDFVFDVLETEGRALPDAAFVFPTLGTMDAGRFDEILHAVSRQQINLVWMSAGDTNAGWVRLVSRGKTRTTRNRYDLAWNRDHSLATQFVTIAHELAHLYLGHLGEDPARHVPDRRGRNHAQCEVEAEMTAWLVAKRNGLTPRSESYLAAYQGAIADLDTISVMRAANGAMPESG